MAKAPAFQFYANDFMDATRFWEANAVGLYIRCLCIQWTQGGLPCDVRSLSKGLGMDFEEFERCWKALASKFELCEDGLLKNSRLEEVRTRQAEVSSKRSNAGKIGAIAKANAKANASTNDKQRKEKVEVEISGKERVHEAKVIPLPFTSEAFALAWAEWETSRREAGKPIKPTGRKLQMAKCIEWGEIRAIAALRHSAANGYQGLFEPNTQRNGPVAKTQSERDAELAAIVAARYATQ